MEQFNISIGKEPNSQTFEVTNAAGNHFDPESPDCTFEVRHQGCVVLILSPDDWLVRKCTNEGGADEKIGGEVTEVDVGRIANFSKNLYPPTSALGSLSL